MQTNLLSFKNASILQYTDSKAAKHILTYGSKNPEIQKLVFDIVIRRRKFGIQLAAVWMSRNEEEMQLADAGSRGPWFPAQEFLLKLHLIDMVRANINFTVDLIATYKNRLTEKYFPVAWEAKSAGMKFFFAKNRK